jgi:hypothetical protein
MHTTLVPTLELSEKGAVTRRVVFLLAAWLVLAVLASASGLISTNTPPPLIPLMIWLPALAFAATLWRSARLRAWLVALDPRVPILYHLVRAGFGAAFLALHADGKLDASFALTAGPGDIVAGLGALVAALCIPISTRFRWRAVWLWNVIALADILLVFVTAQRIILFGEGPTGLAPLTTFPFSMVPAFFVPMILITHLTIFVQLRAHSAQGIAGKK